MKVCGLTTFLTSLSLGLSMVSLQAQAQINQATVTEILDGTEVFIQNSPAQIGDQATFGQRVSTGNARAELRFNTNAVGRLSTNSVLTIGQCADLAQGSVLVNGPINGCTSSIVAGVRGTTYVLTIDETGDESVIVLEGEVSLQRQLPPTPYSVKEENGDTEVPSESVTLTAGQTIAVPEAGPFGSVETMSVEDFRRWMEGALFAGFTDDLPGMQAIRQSFQNLYPNVSFPEPPLLLDPSSDVPSSVSDTPSFPSSSPTTPRF